MFYIRFIVCVCYRWVFHCFLVSRWRHPSLRLAHLPTIGKIATALYLCHRHHHHHCHHHYHHHQNQHHRYFYHHHRHHYYRIHHIPVVSSSLAKKATVFRLSERKHNSFFFVFIKLAPCVSSKRIERCCCHYDYLFLFGSFVCLHWTSRK